jgi:hypothetical protein
MLPSALIGALSPPRTLTTAAPGSATWGCQKDYLQNYSQAGIAPSVPRSWPTELGPNLRWRTTWETLLYTLKAGAATGGTGLAFHRGGARAVTAATLGSIQGIRNLREPQRTVGSCATVPVCPSRSGS